MTPEQAKQGARILQRLNDWLVDTEIGYTIPEPVAAYLGGLLVECMRTKPE